MSMVTSQTHKGRCMKLVRKSQSLNSYSNVSVYLLWT